MIRTSRLTLTDGGWGGHEYHCTEPGIDQNLVVFVHWNTHDACDFAEHATEYLERGYNGDALWSIRFREPTSTHPEMRDQLEDFVMRIRRYTVATTVDIVSHSLGFDTVRDSIQLFSHGKRRSVSCEDVEDAISELEL